MINHTVAFSLKHERGSHQESNFLIEAKKLRSITTVKNFKVLKQLSNKNNFDFGLSMNFDSVQDYEYYNNHPIHINFVQSCWLMEVNDFMEIDYMELSDD
jgi:hypothetical protein